MAKKESMAQYVARRTKDADRKADERENPKPPPKRGGPKGKGC